VQDAAAAHAAVLTLCQVSAATARDCGCLRSAAPRERESRQQRTNRRQRERKQREQREQRESSERGCSARERA
jgi:hypothetical protein